MNKLKSINEDLLKEFYNQNQHMKGIGTYISTYNTLLNQTSNKSLIDIDLKDIEDFLLTANSNHNFNHRISHLVKLYKFIELKHPIKFKPDELHTFKLPAKDVSINARPSLPLNLKELIIAREILEKSNKLNYWFLFEVAYYYGIKSPGEINNYIESNYDTTTQKFKIKGKEVATSDIIKKIISNGGLPKRRREAATYQNHIKEIESLINRPLQFKDFKATHDNFFFTCPNCGDSFENTPENWIIVEDDTNNSKWIICRSNCSSNWGNE